MGMISAMTLANPPTAEAAPPPPQKRRKQHRLHRIAFGWAVSYYIYYLVSQTRRMSSTFFHDYSQYDAPHLHAHPSEAGSPLPSSPSSKLPRRNPALPKWLDDYFHWHVAMREKYPGDRILTDPEAPGVLIKACAFKCGGLHDRLGGLGWDLYLANQTGRVFMMHWCIPAPVENYLVPNLVDWTLPPSDVPGLYDERLFSNTTEAHIHCDRAVQEWRGLFDGYVEYMQGEDFFERNVDLAVERAVHGEYRRHKVLRYKVLGVDQRLEQRLRVRHGETDPVAWTDAFPAAFWTLFRPSAGLQSELDGAYRQLGVSSPFDHSAPPFYALHVRVRHPRGHVGAEIESRAGNKGGADKYGMSWSSATSRDFAIRQAEHALHCAEKRHLDKHAVHAPNYVFYADSEDLVAHMGDEYGYRGVRVRNMTGVEVLHIDRQQQRSPESYYSSFVDLFIAAQASCIVFGAGNYALLAAKINTRGARSCLIRHYPDSSHPMVLRQEFLECNENWDLTPTFLERNISDIPVTFNFSEYPELS